MMKQKYVRIVFDKVECHMRYNLLFYLSYIHTHLLLIVYVNLYFIFQNTHRIVTDITHTYYRELKKKKKRKN